MKTLMILTLALAVCSAEPEYAFDVMLSSNVKHKVYGSMLGGSAQVFFTPKRFGVSVGYVSGDDIGLIEISPTITTDQNRLGLSAGVAKLYEHGSETTGFTFGAFMSPFAFDHFGITIHSSIAFFDNQSIITFSIGPRFIR